MEFQTILYIVLFIIWLLSQLFKVIKKAGRETEPNEPPPAPSLPFVPAHQAQSILKRLEELETNVDGTLAELDEPVRAQTSFLVGGDLLTEAARLRKAIEDALAKEEFPGELERANQLLSHVQETLRAARTQSDWRRRAESRRSGAIADRLVEEFYTPFRSFAESKPLELAEPPPVAVARERPSDTRSPLVASTLYVPRTVTTDPRHWCLFAPELSYYLSGTAPTLYQEIYERLELGVPERADDPEALSRVFFASWIVRFLGDSVGASFFGPAYLRALAHLSAQPRAPSRVTTVRLRGDGTVDAEAPMHVRVHLTSQWLEDMGYASEAGSLRRDWDEWHGSPETLSFVGAAGSLPAAPLLASMAALVGELFHLELDALGNRKLFNLPGLADWQVHARDESEAIDRLEAGERATGSARSLVAAAMEAAIGAPESAVPIATALYESVSLPPAVPGARVRAPVVARRTGRARQPSSAREIAEALILAEVLLEPRRRAR